MEHPLDSIYGVNSSATTSPSHPLDAIYGASNTQTQQQQWSQSLSDVGMPSMQERTPGFLERGVQAIGKAITDPISAIGGGVQNAIRAGGRALGMDTPAAPTVPSVFGGEPVNPVGYRNGQELGPVDTALQGAGDVAMAASNLYTGGETGTVISGVKQALLPKLGELFKGGAVAGGLYGGGSALEQGKSATDIALNTAGGALLGGTIGSVVGGGTMLAGAGKEKIVSGLEDKYTKQAAQDWQKSGSDYIRSGKVLSKESFARKDSPTFLGQLGYSPKDFIVDGKFQTEDIANQLSTQGVKDFEDTLTNTLQEAQYGKSPASTQKIEDAAVRKVASIKNTTPLQKEQIIGNIRQEFEALRRTYGDSIVLPELNVLKGTYWSNTRFDALKPFQSDVNYLIGSSMKDAIETESKSAPVRELNSLLGDYYASAKFLRSLNGRVPKMSTAQKLSASAVKAVATGVGATVGGVPGAISGLMVGKTLTGAMGNISNPVKTMILKNLEKNNPAVYEDALKYIGEQSVKRWSTVKITNSGLRDKTPEIVKAVKKVVK